MFRRFITSSEGSILPIIGIGLLALFGAVGTAVDISRVEMVQAKLSNSLDAAGLAAGATVSTQNAYNTALMYFNVNFPQNYNGATTHNFGLSVSPDNQLLTLSVQADVPTTFMRLFGQNTVTVNASTQITRQSKGMELVLVLDNTGSMGDPVNPADSNTPKITALKSAATELLSILYGSNNTVPNLWVGVVPFTDTVNIGTGYTSWMNASYDATLNWGPKSWSGCVMARPSPYDISDDVPSTSSFQAFYYPTTATTQPGGCNLAVNNYDPWQCTTTTTQNGKTTTTTTYNFNFSTELGTGGPNMGCPQPVTPMVAEQNTIVSAINSMTAQGATTIDIGMAWGWRMLSPNWRGLWGGEMNTNNLPLNYNTPLMNKVIILMTDGMNDMFPGNYTAYQNLSNGVLGTTDYTTADTTLDNRTLSICNSLKANGVIIYTIGFGTNGNDNPNDPTSVNGPLLQSCASNPQYYFLAPTNAELQSAFQQIGDSLANLYISQ